MGKRVSSPVRRKRRRVLAPSLVRSSRKEVHDGSATRDAVSARIHALLNALRAGRREVVSARPLWEFELLASFRLALPNNPGFLLRPLSFSSLSHPLSALDQGLGWTRTTPSCPSTTDRSRQQPPLAETQTRTPFRPRAGSSPRPRAINSTISPSPRPTPSGPCLRPRRTTTRATRQARETLTCRTTPRATPPDGAPGRPTEQPTSHPFRSTPSRRLTPETQHDATYLPRNHTLLAPEPCDTQRLPRLRPTTPTRPTTVITTTPPLAPPSPPLQSTSPTTLTHLTRPLPPPPTGTQTTLPTCLALLPPLPPQRRPSPHRLGAFCPRLPFLTSKFTAD